jgi:hypothetical protein
VTNMARSMLSTRLHACSTCARSKGHRSPGQDGFMSALWAIAFLRSITNVRSLLILLAGTSAKTSWCARRTSHPADTTAASRGSSRRPDTPGSEARGPGQLAIDAMINAARFDDVAVAGLCAAIGLSGASITFLIAALWPDWPHVVFRKGGTRKLWSSRNSTPNACSGPVLGCSAT